MKRFVIILICMLTCLALFAGCINKKSSRDQNMDLNNSVGTDISDEVDNADDPTRPDNLPDGFVYSFKDPENAGGITVTPRG